MSQLYVVSYDVMDTRRRNRVSRALEGFGQRVQHSVFECWLDDGQLVALKQALASEIDPAEDHIRYYPLCPKDVQRLIMDGKAKISSDPDYHVV